MLNTSGGLPTIVASIIQIFNQLIPVIAVLGVVFFMIGVIKYIYSEGESDKRTMVVWSLVALFVLFSVWGILRLVCSTFTGNASCSASGISQTR